ncbi:hypothetical protein J31TS3_39150 [Paenibacillus lactis]|nr:hypothetical protein J31TS3_39150 [Paenibacillus lactis]
MSGRVAVIRRFSLPSASTRSDQTQKNNRCHERLRLFLKLRKARYFFVTLPLASIFAL